MNTAYVAHVNSKRGCVLIIHRKCHVVKGMRSVNIDIAEFTEPISYGVININNCNGSSIEVKIKTKKGVTKNILINNLPRWDKRNTATNHRFMRALIYQVNQTLKANDIVELISFNFNNIK